MKNFIYLLAIITVLFSSCRNGSFLAQRYTHFNHSSVDKHAVHVQAKQRAASVSAITPAPAPENEPVVKTAAESVVPMPAVAANPTASAEKASGKKLLPVAQLKKLTGTVKVTAKKAIKSVKERKSSSHRGLIFGVINMALFIVLVVLVAAAVLYLLAMVL